MGYSAEAIPRLKALYDWANVLVTACSQYLPGKTERGVPDVIENFDTQPTLKRNITGLVGSGGDDGFGNSFAEQPTSTVDSIYPETHSVTNLTRRLGPAGSVSVDKKWTDLEVALDKTLATAGFAVVSIPPDFQALLDTFERVLGYIDVVEDTDMRDDGFAQWDATLDVFQADLDTSTLAALGHRLETVAAKKYEILLGQALAYAGISPRGKFNASSVSVDGCWQDYGDAKYWQVVGSENGPYAPAFTNRPYYSSQMTPDGYRSTREFAFQINVACVPNLKVGDRVTLVITDAATAGTYQVGDTLQLPVIAAHPLYLSGGQDGNAVQTWYVTGSVNGAFAPYTYDPESPAPYSDGGLSFDLIPGGIDFQQGDEWRVAIEGGHYRWRKDGGSWSSPLPIPLTPDVMDSGLSVGFTTGAAPSFSAGDRFRFRALQPWAVSNVRSPTAAVWKWDTDGATLIAEADEETAIDTIAFLHDLPEGAVVTVEGSADGVTYDWLETLTWRPNVMWAIVDEVAKFVRISISGAEGGSIKWGWIGTALATSLTCDVILRRGYKMSRVEAGLVQGGRFLGKAVSGEATWSDGALSEADVAALSDMLDWQKEHDDEPLIFLPQITRSDQPALVALVDSDLIALPDVFAYQPNDDVERRLSASIPLAGVWQ